MAAELQKLELDRAGDHVPAVPTRAVHTIGSCSL
jgi:hypothetical protein